MSLHEKKSEGKKHSPVRIILLTLLALLLLSTLSLALFVQSKLGLIRYEDGTAAPAPPPAAEEDGEPELELDTAGLEEAETPPPAAEGAVKTEEHVINFLLLGTDERSGSFSDNARADAILLLSLDTRDYSARLVSLERGMGVPILEGEYAGEYDWLTHCFRYGGADLMVKEVQYCFKVDVEHFVRVNFSAVEAIVDTLGGIDIELTPAEVQYFWDGRGWTGLQPGVNHLNGEQALAYARLREIDSDWSRIQRQRRVIQACVDTVKTTDLPTLNALCNEILPLVSTNLSRKEIIRLLALAPHFIGVEFQQMTIPVQGSYGHMSGLGGRSLFAVDFEENAARLQEFLYGGETAG